MQGCQFLKILKNDTWSHFPDKNVVSMPEGIKFGSLEVRAKACHKSVGTLKIKELCAGLPVFEIFEKQHVESLPRPKCSSHTKKDHDRISGSRDYPIIQPASESVSQ